MASIGDSYDIDDLIRTGDKCILQMKYEESLTYYRRVLELFPGYSRVTFRIGLVENIIKSKLEHQK